MIYENSIWIVLNSEYFQIKRKGWYEDVIKMELRTRIHDNVNTIERIQKMIKDIAYGPGGDRLFNLKL